MNLHPLGCWLRQFAIALRKARQERAAQPHATVVLFAASALLLSATPPAEAAQIFADATASWRFFDRDRADVVGVATASGRACASGLFGRDQDPGGGLGGCAGGLRLLPPNASADLFPFENIYGRATFAFDAATNTKTIRVVAFGIAGVADAEAKDPIVFDAIASSRSIVGQIALSGIDMSSASGSTSHLHFELASNITGALPLFTLEIDAQGSLAPVVDFEIASLLASQPGWVKSSLDSQLTNALTAGAMGNGEFAVATFSLPSLQIDVSGARTVEIYTDQSAFISAAVPEPGTTLLLAVGGSALIAWRRRPASMFTRSRSS